MYLSSLVLSNVRNIDSARVEPVPGINWLYGDNGAGKTSVLEAIHLLGRGQSFRTNRMAAVIADNSRQLRIFAHTQDPEHRLGVERSAGAWLGRIDGQPAMKVSAFARCLPLVLIDPENHQLVEGGPALRRSFLDWGLFHVEQSYLGHWRRYSRLLRQRNAALRDHAHDAVLDSIEPLMAQAALEVESRRVSYTHRVMEALRRLEPELEFRLPELQVAYRPVAADEAGYLETWRDSRQRDREQGFTRDGPQRGDLVIRAGDKAVANRFSRGQMKLAALMLKLAQAEVREQGGGPVLLIDDPVSELDGDHLDRLLSWLEQQPLQCWITAVEPGPRDRVALFHVEQGRIGAVV